MSETWIADNILTIIGMGSMLIVTAVSVGITYGTLSSRIKGMIAQIKNLENKNSDEVKWTVGEHSKQIDELKVEQKELRATLSELKSDTAEIKSNVNLLIKITTDTQCKG